jgi:3-dehydroquinate synthase
MSQRISVGTKAAPLYDIVIEHDYTKLSAELDRIGCNGKKVCVITDSKVAPLYLEEIKGILGGCFAYVTDYVIPEGENSKNLDTVSGIYKKLIEEHFGRNDILAALGGGVTGDITGFAAATYQRGISFIQLPTTLLAQCDSSIGGKTGVDLDGYKNMVGAFHMPSLVYSNVGTLRTLDGRQFVSGFAEVMKSALIKDASFYSWLIDKMYEIKEKDPSVLEEMVQQSCLIKKSFVDRDPFEKGDRAMLNYGHTVGHAIEKYKKFEMLHGECVALGCVAAAFISWKHELLSMDEYYEIRDMFVPFGLPISVEDVDPAEIAGLTHSDKKAGDGTLKFILLKRVGKAVIDTSVTDDDIIAAVNELLFDEKE